MDSPMQNRKPSPWGEGGWPKARRMRGQVSASSFVGAAHRAARERPKEFAPQGEPLRFHLVP